MKSLKGPFVSIALLAAVHASAAPVESDFKPQGEATAGAATVPGLGANAFSFPFANLTQEERRRFAIGNSFFKRNWVQAPASTTARDGLGPHFIARSCGACHAFDGRGQPPEQFEGLNKNQPVDLLIRISVEPAQLTDEQLAQIKSQGVIPHPVYGDQINNDAVPGVTPEAAVQIRTREQKGQYPDGQAFSLLVPEYSLDKLAYGPLGADAKLSPRIAPQLIGAGLLEAIPESEILANETKQSELASLRSSDSARAGSAISGRTNWVSDPYLGSKVLGRFGWKANAGSLAGQSAGAFRGDIGITSSKVSDSGCMPAQTDCLAAPSGGKPGEPEVPDRILNEVIFYQSVLAPPARRNWDSEQVKLGEKLFHQSQCAACHRPSYVTGKSPLPDLSSRSSEGLEIWPYTDLLLHDMGEGLSDGRRNFLAEGAEWRTPPLWGIGLIPAVNGHSRLLHDGRARNVEEAILWHAGEALNSRDHFMKLSESQRTALIKFVESL